MEKGKLKNGSILLCKECLIKYETLISLNNYSNSTEDSYRDPDHPISSKVADLFETIINSGKK